VLIVCFNGKSLADHAEFTGVRELRKVDDAQSVRAKTASIAFAGDRCCLWRQGSTSFIPDDPFDNTEYARWLMGK